MRTSRYLNKISCAGRPSEPREDLGLAPFQRLLLFLSGLRQRCFAAYICDLLELTKVHVLRYLTNGSDYAGNLPLCTNGLGFGYELPSPLILPR
jgi:hypothetical protein